MDVDLESEDPQTDLDPDDIEVRMPDKKRFKPNDFDTKQYHKEVYRIIVTNMEVEDRLDYLYAMSFDRKYSKALKFGNYTKPDPVFDAWMCVYGKSRDQFDPKLLIKYYPNVTDKIKRIRRIVRVSPPLEEATDSERYYRYSFGISVVVLS